ncbi:phosphatase PAP2 family protein [Yinghuangia seranimata]|uniref:phosphatase PAP2 family protein n=1 Tax=Yinghuangia seranimata TaxID=408067 RepID=UPI00248CA2E1|nr:phosphatase PAP2 family protein [Yinghuangia seranimata]MDI2129157.1 phosphatase PAP2 family protein [Yinghuangia seranimata]
MAHGTAAAGKAAHGRHAAGDGAVFLDALAGVAGMAAGVAGAVGAIEEAGRHAGRWTLRRARRHGWSPGGGRVVPTAARPAPRPAARPTTPGPGKGVPAGLERAVARVAAPWTHAVPGRAASGGGLLGRVHELDHRAFAWLAEHHVPWANRALPALSRSANHSRLWVVAAGSMALSGGRSGRRAALRGLGSVALASTVTNVVLKSWTRRPRPVIDLVPEVRRLARQPWTTSFPSGHAASAAAFATGVALESRSMGAAAGVLAGGVALSRVYTGVHYPGDVLAGAALGAGLAAVTLRWWPRRPVEAAFAPAPRVPVPLLADGDGLVVVVNASAGPEGEIAPRLRELLPLAKVVERGPGAEAGDSPDGARQPSDAAAEDPDGHPDAGSDLMAMLRQAASEAVVLGVAGGDGTINAAAKIALEYGRPLAVFPAGTLNHFAGDLGLQRLEDTARAVRAGEAVLVDVAEIARDRTFDFGPMSATEPEVFLNTFSIGVYPDLVRAREAMQGRIGKWPAMLVGLVAVLRDARPVKLRVNGRARSVWLLFLGNGAYAPPGFAPAYRPNLHDGLLDVRLVDAAKPAARTRLVAAVLSGTLGRSRVYEASTARAMRLTEIQAGAPLAVDGEVRPGASQLRIAKGRRLVVYRPAGARRA